MSVDHDAIAAALQMLEEIELLVSTTAPLPEGRTPRVLELLNGVTGIVKDIGARPRA